MSWLIVMVSGVTMFVNKCRIPMAGLALLMLTGCSSTVTGSMGAPLTESLAIFHAAEASEGHVTSYAVRFEPQQHQRSEPSLTVALPSPLDYTRSYSDGTWRIDGIGIIATPDVEILASGRVNEETDRLQATLSIRFRF